ncbi:rCG28207, isoform CRA_a [Rattus norvegicus]|uniref:RCG28207, isoform CRA_a n=1 Tax=Rattus norvegicus TaxID=10116 RepID=A6IDY8_RAT|nr:rCG28207, isoform CRA_a [Rattus norvegicus]
MNTEVFSMAGVTQLSNTASGT